MTATLVLTGPSSVELQDIPTPEPGPGQCLIDVAYVGICGTDVALYTGRSTYLREGLTSYPVRFGHEWSGVVRALGAGTVGLAAGDRVAGHNFGVCGLCSECRVGRRWLCLRRSEAGVRGDVPGAAGRQAVLSATTMVALPDAVSLRHAACLEPITCSRRALSRCVLDEADRVAVVGTGMLGLAGVQLARLSGARVDAVGVEAAGLALADQLGADATLTPGEAAADRYDVVLEASGSADGIGEALRIAAPAGRIGQVGVAHERVDNADFAAIVLKDLTLHGSIGGLDQWDQVVGLVARGRLEIEALIEATIPYAQAGDALEHLDEGQRSRPKILLEFDPTLDDRDV